MTWIKQHHNGRVARQRRGWQSRKGHSHGTNDMKPLQFVWGGPTHKWYPLMSPKHTRPHVDGAPNIHTCPIYTYAQIWAKAYSPPCGRGTQHTLSPNMGVVSTPTPLPSVWDTYHTYPSRRFTQASAIPHGRGNQPNACHYLHLYGT